METLLRSCAEMHTAIEQSFGVVSGVGPDIDVLDEGPCASREEAVSVIFGICTSIHLNGRNDVLFVEKCI